MGTGVKNKPYRRIRLNRISAVSIAAVVSMLAACGIEHTPNQPPASPDSDVQRKTAHPSLIFGQGNTNPYTVDISGAATDPDSQHFMNNIRGQFAANKSLVPLNTDHYNSAFVVADTHTPRTNLTFDNCQKKPGTPPGLYDGPAHFTNVPIPADATPAKGNDGALAIWSPQTDQVWEFWQVKKKGEGAWSACWGGRLDHASGSNGVFPVPYGTSASGLVTIGSMISLAEARNGNIPHAMNLGLTSIATQPIVVPANRTDGTSTERSAPPMGSRLRLDPSLNVDALNLTPLGKTVAKAAQKYGFIVTESADVPSIGVESGLHEKQRTGKDPWEAILGGTPSYEQLRNFPWEHVHVIQLGYAPEGVPGGEVNPHTGQAATPAK
ncbi:Uncharacterised protein [Dermatophilus congolensis]|uniref:Uncharacterized protein n=1 Tax=Dermatophilus congolensis TaxID=1863 RepID=A0AA46BLQ4_9MICO|nr:hypothetical protein [Dermatophilus congolensis]STD04873.1 Uncharacterised protein [Dermatophilus congolensis]